jgi:hypothetical protein
MDSPLFIHKQQELLADMLWRETFRLYCDVKKCGATPRRGRRVPMYRLLFLKAIHTYDAP